MPTVLLVGRYRIVVFTNDHNPAQVHVIGGEGRAKIELGAFRRMPKLVEVAGINKADIKAAMRKIMAAVSDHRQFLLECWREIHGQGGGG